MAQPETVIIYVTYSGNADSRFDRDYYVARHLPMVMLAWGKYGLQSIEAYFPAVKKNGTVALCECRFSTEMAVAAAFESLEMHGIMDDIPKFTDLEPARARAIAM